ncbi:hypothetical protein [Azospirillum rugosum]|uniref:Uncharacterized protein n=1 Tax=Azospirillum rugosum TaxID=416170 RepID=A0ABS4SG57_9PROT|nr:hypothetical protein [Azospirillum rugosum]MBP2291551.1 hypothetical protein [Azospirillum rugosum]MDQ0525340.1 hypothetical protein [Azospirillum rugosum]
MRSGSGLLPKRGRGIAILIHFFLQGGRQMVVRVPLRDPQPDGLRTVSVLVTLQPDGDVLVALPREAVESGRFDARSAARLALRLRRLLERTTTANPLWGVDATQALGEVAGVATGVASGVLLLRNGFAEMTGGVMAHAGATAVLLVAPVILAKLRPWLIGALVPWVLRRL